jgi:hypothetical protein
MTDKKEQKVPQHFSCEKCDFVASRVSQYNRHLLTRKHTNTYNADDSSSKKFKCELCNKVYKHRQSLHKHKIIHEKEEKDDYVEADFSLVMELVKQNQEFKQMMMEQNKHMMEIAQKMSITNNNNINNTQNNQFNLQFFLNETCKDAMNINQFIDSIQIKLEDLDYTGKYGYAKGISNVIVRELKSLDQKDRPMHCSDEKRETLYVKMNTVWEKDIERIGVIRVAKHIAHKKFLKMNEWVSNNPNCTEYDDKKNDQYLEILGQIISGINQLNDKDHPDQIHKIVKSIIKHIVIQKN